MYFFKKNEVRDVIRHMRKSSETIQCLLLYTNKPDIMTRILCRYKPFPNRQSYQCSQCQPEDLFPGKQ